ncbi:hypothetical protein [Actinomadura sp. NEAU-AAG7]|uniref:hypothetical protein n=1 Tax=Actinomadura sp. NEAU-AAG7 TaxID=2839640 RepID=UPI001BE447A9|nr:hypothetical protein [Actinomadura sp. NEAU-AAG7]MBT2207268.1 hypothetical protein [Actinomadura sp. NEAU-AAG7]
MLGGNLLGALPCLSYGLLPLYAVPLTVVVLGRPRLPILVALTCGLVAVPALPTIGGFWWFDGVRVTHTTYLISRGSAQRFFTYYAFANFAVLGLLAGPPSPVRPPGHCTRSDEAQSPPGSSTGSKIGSTTRTRTSRSRRRCSAPSYWTCKALKLSASLGEQIEE